MPVSLTIVYEDLIHEALIKKTTSIFGDKFKIMRNYNERGNSQLKLKIKAFNHAAKAIPHLVLTDLDRVPCPLELIKTWLPQGTASNMIFRVAVREAEAWILAHREAISTFLGVPINKFPLDADGIDDPKLLLINLARKSKKKAIKSGIPPKVGSTATIGSEYNTMLTEWINDRWEPRTAAKHSNSLNRMLIALDKFPS